jgi:hypothetical protein
MAILGIRPSRNHPLVVTTLTRYRKHCSLSCAFGRGLASVPLVVQNRKQAPLDACQLTLRSHHRGNGLVH